MNKEERFWVITAWVIVILLLLVIYTNKNEDNKEIEELNQSLLLCRLGMKICLDNGDECLQTYKEMQGLYINIDDINNPNATIYTKDEWLK